MHNSQMMCIYLFSCFFVSVSWCALYGDYFRPSGITPNCSLLERVVMLPSRHSTALSRDMTGLHHITMRWGPIM